jgi:hypothetical protein
MVPRVYVPGWCLILYRSIVRLSPEESGPQLPRDGAMQDSQKVGRGDSRLIGDQ